MPVDRTDESIDESTSAEIAGRFGLGTPRGPLTRPAEGVMGRVFELRTDSGRWAVKGSFEPVDPEAAATDLRLQEAARDAGIALPEAIRALDGSPVQTVDGRDWRVYRWVEEATRPEPADLSDIARSAGEVMARLHALRLPGTAEVSPWLTVPPGDDDWSALELRVARSGKAWAPRFAEVMSGVPELSGIVRAAAELPTVLSHCDVTPDNVAVQPDGTLLVLDWEHAGSLPPVRELGYALIHWAVGPRGTVDIDVAAALAAGYRGAGGDPGPLHPSVFAAGACGWLNFLLAASDSALDEDDDGRRRFGEANVDVVLDRALSVRTLDELAAAAELKP